MPGVYFEYEPDENEEKLNEILLLIKKAKKTRFPPSKKEFFNNLIVEIYEKKEVLYHD